MKQLGLAPDRLTSLPQEFTLWDVDHKNSVVGFSIEQHNLVSTPFRPITGRFLVYAGAIKAFSDDFSDAKINFTVIVGSIDTGNHKRDRHLRSSTFFDVQKFPEIKFASIAFVQEKENRFILEGNLTIRNITRRVVFDAIPRQKGDRDDQSAKFTIIGTINRLDFLLTGSVLSEIFIGKDITISLELEFLKQRA